VESKFVLLFYETHILEKMQTLQAKSIQFIPFSTISAVKLYLSI